MQKFLIGFGLVSLCFVGFQRADAAVIVREHCTGNPGMFFTSFTNTVTGRVDILWLPGPCYSGPYTLRTYILAIGVQPAPDDGRNRFEEEGYRRLTSWTGRCPQRAEASPRLRAQFDGASVRGTVYVPADRLSPIIVEALRIAERPLPRPRR